MVTKTHIQTGCDVTSKIGTRLAALKQKPSAYLQKFACQNDLTEEEIEKAEEYLVNVWHSKSKTECKTFNQLRSTMYISKRSPLLGLPPTSHSIL